VEKVYTDADHLLKQRLFWGRIWKPYFGGFQLEKELFEELDCLSCGTKGACRRSEWDGSTDFDRSLKAEEA
jgi:hypothetical protein